MGEGYSRLIRKEAFMEKFIMAFENRLRRWGAFIIGVPVFLMAIVETLNGFGRKLWGPFPCAVETVESLLVIVTYFGVSIVAMERGHVKVDLLTRNFPRSLQNYITIFADVVGTIVFGLLGYGAWKMAIYSTSIMEVRIGVYDFPLWPFKLLFAAGITLFVIQLAINIVKFIRVSRGDTHYADVDKIQAAEEAHF
jgi:TRAP-type C4-dicarboxylate transport system permease small subunit